MDTARNWEDGRRGVTPEGYRDSYWVEENALQLVHGGDLTSSFHRLMHGLAVCRHGEGPAFIHLKCRFHGMNYVTF